MYMYVYMLLQYLTLEWWAWSIVGSGCDKVDTSILIEIVAFYLRRKRTEVEVHLMAHQQLESCQRYADNEDTRNR